MATDLSYFGVPIDPSHKDTPFNGALAKSVSLRHNVIQNNYTLPKSVWLKFYSKENQDYLIARILPYVPKCKQSGFIQSVREDIYFWLDNGTYDIIHDGSIYRTNQDMLNRINDEYIKMNVQMYAFDPNRSENFCDLELNREMYDYVPGFNSGSSTSSYSNELFIGGNGKYNRPIHGMGKLYDLTGTAYDNTYCGSGDMAPITHRKGWQRQGNLHHRPIEVMINDTLEHPFEDRNFISRAYRPNVLELMARRDKELYRSRDPLYKGTVSRDYRDYNRYLPSSDAVDGYVYPWRY
jgi:hypothetical protein